MTLPETLHLAKTEAAPPVAPRGQGWAADFVFTGLRVQVKKTGADLRLDGVLAAECLLWLAFHLVVSARAAWLRLRGRRGPAIWFAPDTPRPWYLVRAAMAWGGMVVADAPARAAAAFYFDDSTCGPNLAPLHRRGLNFACNDISKSRVAAVFEQVFGYPLALNPRIHRGPAVEKGEENGAHDGRLVDCPTLPLPGRTYQRLVDTVRGGFAEDLRTPCVGGRPVVVWVKRKPAHDRFSIHNLSVRALQPEAVYSPDELVLIERFCQAMGLDWGGLDILRDADGRLYVVDVNKTDVGPVIALNWRDKFASTGLLARALRRLVEDAAPSA